MSPDGRVQTRALRMLGWTVAALAAFFVLETVIELDRSGVSWASLHANPEHGRALATTVSRAYNNLLAMVLAFVSLAIPLTANMYTPKLVEIFFSDRWNLAGLLFFAAMAAHALFAQWVMFDRWAPQVHIQVLWTSGVLGFALVIPYYLYVLDFLNPATIIGRVRDRVTSQYPSIARGASPEDGRSTNAALQRRVHERVLQLGNVVLRAVDRADRDVAIDAISALEAALFAYVEPKKSAPASWFTVNKELFPGLSDEAIALLHRDRSWVEHRFLSQLDLAYVAALAKMPDAISAISRVARKIALHAEKTGDDAVLALTIRFFNTFLRTAVNRRDLHAVFDVLHQYRRLAVELLPRRPDRAAEIVRHMRYYAGLGRDQGLGFVFELAAAESAEVVEAAYAADAPSAGPCLDEFVAFHGAKPSARLTKAASVLAAYFAGSGRDAEAARVRALLAAAPRELLEAARRDIAVTTDPVFWEVTDRQTNLDYVEPARREAVVALLDELLQTQRS